MVRKKVVRAKKTHKSSHRIFPTWQIWVMSESTKNGTGNTDVCTLWVNHIQNMWTHSTNKHTNHMLKQKEQEGWQKYFPSHLSSYLPLIFLGFLFLKSWIFPADTATWQLDWTLKPLLYAMCVYPNERIWTDLLKNLPQKNLLPAVKNTQSSNNYFTFQRKYLTLRSHLWFDFLILCTWSMFNLLGECFPLIHRLLSDA